MTAPTTRANDTPAGGITASRTRRVPRVFYLVVALLMIAIVGWGFWPPYFGPLLERVFPVRPTVIHVHAAVFVGWMLLLILQALLAATRRLRLHRRIGRYGLAYGILVLLSGLTATFVAPVLHVSAGEWTVDQAASFLIYPIGDLLLFGGFFWAAAFYRSNGPLHKRMMVLATTALIFPGAARALSPTENVPLFLAVWLAPLLLAMLRDLVKSRLIHGAYVAGTIILLGAYVRVFFAESGAWLWIGRAMLSPVL